MRAVLLLLLVEALSWAPGLGREARAADGRDLAHLEATRLRPLFSPTRRPPPVVAVVAAPAPLAPAAVPAPPPAVQLTGVIIGDKRMAIVRRAADPRPINIEVGSTIDGWTVSAISSREIELRQERRVVTIALPSH
jgi:general secretion pathway protein N